MLRSLHARRPSSAHPRRVVAVALLALAVLAAQALGVGHRIAHGPVATGVAQAAWIDPVAPMDASQGSESRSRDHDHGAGQEHDCAAFEHATVADVAPSPEPPRVDGPTRRAIGTWALSTPTLAAQAAGYLARGPPAA